MLRGFDPTILKCKGQIRAHFHQRASPPQGSTNCCTYARTNQCWFFMAAYIGLKYNKRQRTPFSPFHCTLVLRRTRFQFVACTSGKNFGHVFFSCTLSVSWALLHQNKNMLIYFFVDWWLSVTYRKIISSVRSRTGYEFVLYVDVHGLKIICWALHH